MSYSWTTRSPQATRPLPAQQRTPHPTRRAEQLHRHLNRAAWWLTTLTAATCTALHLLAANPNGALPWVTLYGLGLIAQSHIRLQQQVDTLAHQHRSRH